MRMVSVFCPEEDNLSLMPLTAFLAAYCTYAQSASYHSLQNSALLLCTQGRRYINHRRSLT